MAALQRTFVVTKAQAPTARKITRTLAIPQGEGMFFASMSPTGNNPATHYVSNGMIHEDYADLFFDADDLWAAMQAMGNTQGITYQHCVDVVANMQGAADADPFVFFDSIGLQMISAPPLLLVEWWERYYTSDDDPLLPPPDFSIASLPPVTGAPR